MSCTTFQSGGLVGYHFGEVTAQERSEIELHLIECRDCLREFLAIKRQIETAEAGARPSSAARARIRAAVAGEIRPRKQSVSWWAWPMAACVAGVALVLAMAGTHAIQTSGGGPPHALTRPG
jgi:anti-sigma factor RsiW